MGGGGWGGGAEPPCCLGRARAWAGARSACAISYVAYGRSVRQSALAMAATVAGASNVASYNGGRSFVRHRRERICNNTHRYQQTEQTPFVVYLIDDRARSVQGCAGMRRRAHVVQVELHSSLARAAAARLRGARMARRSAARLPSSRANAAMLSPRCSSPTAAAARHLPAVSACAFSESSSAHRRAAHVLAGSTGSFGGRRRSCRRSARSRCSNSPTGAPFPHPSLVPRAFHAATGNKGILRLNPRMSSGAATPQAQRNAMTARAACEST